METKHTPGPWSWGTDPMENICDITLDIDATGYSILRCCVKPLEPNARLIAAAPELLEALELAHAMLSGANMNANVVEQKVRAAIAKATGKNNEL